MSTSRNLSTQDLRKVYSGRAVVKGVSITVEPGSIVGLLGPNGAGKTTCFYMVVGLTRPDAGHVFLGDEDLTDLPMYLRARRGISYLPQEPSIFQRMSVEDNISCILETLTLPIAEKDARLEQLIEQFGLHGVRKNAGYALSGGERRRVEIARALVINPAFILLDEPFAGIDPIAVREIQQIVAHLRDMGIGVLITDHNVRDTLKITDTAYIINSGEILRFGTPTDLSMDPEVRKIYLGEDFTLSTAARAGSEVADRHLMALEQKLQLKLAQKLVMTPSLQQAIKLLQMTRLELQGVVSQELEENPVLEEGDESFEEEEAADSADGKEEKEAEPEEVGEADSMDDLDVEAFFSDYIDGPSGPPRAEPREAPPLENTLSREPDLYDHLLWQIHMSEMPPRQSEIAEIIVGNLDTDGFLVATREEIRAMGDGVIGGESYSEAEVDDALEFVRGLDPPGIACFDLRESLLRQLDAAGEPNDSLVYQVVADHWDLFLKRQLGAVAQQLGVELAELEAVVAAIRELETRPGRKFSPERTHYVEPDVYVLKVGDEYVIQLNDDGMPKLRINRAYRRMLRELKAEGGQTETKNFIKEKLRSALWLLKSLDQRQRTIYKVADSIVQQQQSFLDHGINRLRPMVLRDVADDIGMHESTVSRVVSNKYMHTPRGLLPMKFFFHSGIDREYGSDISSLTVKRKIQHLIEAEEEKHPLSDSELTRILKREGINIARRTVAKYRDELQIPSSTHRKKIF